MREIFSEVFTEMYHKEPEMQAIHAGLECGLIAEKMPDLDMISIGPNMKDIHTPMEALDMKSTIRVYQFVEKLLERIK